MSFTGHVPGHRTNSSDFTHKAEIRDTMGRKEKPGWQQTI
jgi:hypothetical protein